MENGTSTQGGTSDDRRDVQDSRNTTSAFPDLEDEQLADQFPPTEAMRFPWSSPPAAPNSPAAPAPPSPTRPQGHRRSVSGSILSRLNFLRSSAEDDAPSRDKESPKSPNGGKSRKSIDDDEPTVSPTSPNGESAMSSALKQGKTRRRKGSLRKTALLGTKRATPETRERKSSFLQRNTKQSTPQDIPAVDPIGSSLEALKIELDPLATSTDHIESPTSMGQPASAGSPEPEKGWDQPTGLTAARLSLVTDQKSGVERDLISPVDVKSPTSQASYASTTDDDDILTFDRPAALQKALSSATAAYFPGGSETSLPIPHASGTSLSKLTHSPLAHTMSSTASSLYPPELDAGHDYTETEYWGWVILFVTWLTFTVGMGSCLDIWSWAWDVDQKPYAPPELEDDPTLPIVGYYPALIVLTGVVAWAWISVAWVGMKYFRHAKIEV